MVVNRLCARHASQPFLMAGARDGVASQSPSRDFVGDRRTVIVRDVDPMRDHAGPRCCAPRRL